MIIEFKKQAKSFNALSAKTTVKELKGQLEKVYRLNFHRQALSVKPAEGADPKSAKKLDDDSKTLGEYGVNIDKDVLILKDYGPQIGYRTVFVVEYLGPILIMLAYYLRPSFIYGEKASQNKSYNEVAMWGVVAWVAHFVKRELETFFVHKFSRPTMPLSNLFKNSIYYWGFALAVGYPLCHPSYTAPADRNQVLIGAALMAVSELVNFLVHLQLSMMRPAEGSKKRDAPGGFLFSLVSCPNYTAEVLGWVGFTIMTQIALSGVFCLVGFLQMTQWALQKHGGYIKADPEYKRLRRKAIVPFLL
jgi:very-long-chain enoyl-CoA reductase